MDKNLNVFHNDVEVPEIVQRKADAAFAEIRKETEEMKNDMNRVYMEDFDDDEEKSTVNWRQNGETNHRYLHFFKSQAAAAACVAVIAGTGITAAAAGFHLWSRGMQGTVQATPEEQQSLIDQGMAVTDGSSSSNESDGSLSSLAVTDKGITVVPDTLIVDDRFAHVSFSVKGYSLENGKEPFIKDLNVYLDSEIGHMDLSDTGKDVIARIADCFGIE